MTNLKIDLRHIPEALVILKGEWERQDAMEKAASHHWRDNGNELVGQRGTSPFRLVIGGFMAESDNELAVLSRYLNPSRLRVAKELLDRTTESHVLAERFARDENTGNMSERWNESAAVDLKHVTSLLGIEVV